MDEGKIASQKSQIIRIFPNISAIETSTIKKSLADVFILLEKGIGGIEILLLLASSITIFSFLIETARSRKKTKKMLQKIGMDETTTHKIFLLEIMFLLLLPFLFSVFLSIITVWILSFVVFDLTSLSVSILPFGLFAGVFLGGIFIGRK